MERCSFSSKDAREASLLFRATVRTVNTRDCTPEQIIISLQLHEVVEQEAHDVPSHRPRELLERPKLLCWDAKEWYFTGMWRKKTRNEPSSILRVLKSNPEYISWVGHPS